MTQHELDLTARWGTEPLLVYAVRRRGEPPLSLRIAGVSSSFFLLEGDEWRGAQIDLFELSPAESPPTPQAALHASMLALGKGGAALSFSLFEGVFLDAGRQFGSPWHQERTIAIGLPHEEPRLATTLIERQTDSWRQLCARARAELVALLSLAEST